ncbi:hypothetical protein HaLaN_17494, partial [Haematococcus lacustris]
MAVAAVSAGRAVPSFVRPQFLDAKHRVWGQLWNTVDGASKLAAQAGEVSLLPKQAPVITPSALAAAEPLLDTHTPVGLQNMALIYLGVHGQFRIKELYSLTRNSFAEYIDPKDLESRVMFKLDPLACKNWNGGLKDAGRPPPGKFIVPNPDYVATGDRYADAKHCPFLCVKLLLEKLPTPCAVDALFLKANAEYQKKNLWYIAQPLGIKTL